jgi:hypothetical protein
MVEYHADQARFDSGEMGMKGSVRRYHTIEAATTAALVEESRILIRRMRAAIDSTSRSKPMSREQIESSKAVLREFAWPSAARTETRFDPPTGTDESRELITHIERCRALLRGVRDTVQKAVLADMVRYMEGKLKQITCEDRTEIAGDRFQGLDGRSRHESRL